MTIRIQRFGEFEGRRVDRAVLIGDTGVTVHILNYGAIIQDWHVPAGDGAPLSVVLGFDDMTGYREHSRFFGAVAGRVVNRTCNARFVLEGRTYEITRNHGRHHLHGGAIGLAKRVWEMETDDETMAVRLTCRSPDGEDGYPGAVDFTVTYRLSGSRLDMVFTGIPDRPTPINIAQHSYFNLNDAGDIRDHVLIMRADRYTAVDDELIPTGEVLPVGNTAFDFRAGRSIGTDYDINLVLEEGHDTNTPAASVQAPKTGLGLVLWTDQPGIQLFNAPGFDIAYPGLGGRKYGNFCGFCLECQHFPDSLNNPHFPSIIATPDSPYRQRMIVDIGRSEET